MDRGDGGAVERAIEFAPLAGRDDRAGGEAERLQQAGDLHGVGGEHFAQQRDASAVPRAGRAAPATGPRSASLRAKFSMAAASTSLASACVGTPKPGTSMPMTRTPSISLGSRRKRHAGGGRHAQVDDDDGVVFVGIGELEHRLANVLEQLAGDQRLRVERDVSDGAPRAVEMRGEGQAVDAAGGARQDGRRAAHAQADAQRAERRAHALRLVVRAGRIVLGVARRASRSCPRFCAAARIVSRAGVATEAVGRRRGLVTCALACGARQLRGSGGASRVMAASHALVDDFERRLGRERRAAHVLHRRRQQRHMAAGHVGAEQAEQAILGQRLGLVRQGSGDIGASSSNRGAQRPPGLPTIS